jgi:cation diffusion facilitator family transporter
MADTAETSGAGMASPPAAAPGDPRPLPAAALVTAVEDRRRVVAALVSLVAGAALLAVKYFAYVHTGSAAVLSDALESIVNIVAAAFAIASLVFASRPADRGHPYGHGKIEYMSAVFEGGLIAFAALMILWYAVRDLVIGPAVQEIDLGLTVTAGAGAANAALGGFLIRTGRRMHSITLVADGQHVLSDFKTSLGVVIGLLLVRVTGWAWLDPLAAIVVGANLAWTGVRLVRQAAGGLLDEEDPALLGRVVAACDAERRPGIIRIHRLRAIRSGRRTHADIHVIVPEYWTVEEGHEAIDAFERRVLAAARVEGDIALHADPCHRALCAACDVTDCPVRREPFAGRPPFTVEEAVLTDELFWRAQMEAAGRREDGKAS